jgi:outer membrane receptor protein involved in Fe transport
VLLAPEVSAQQDTSLILQPERLRVGDILRRQSVTQPRISTAATRTAEQAANLPYYVWVINSEEILNNGFVTLADVMRAAPGMRVSQPGNAIEGETFMMRGLSGNQYVKVLINNIPVKPRVALGMPIGAQIPIRQAERIEVVYGPASALFGDEACAGVVNIILKETERPIFTQADLSFGSYGYNSLDLTFGGKLGRDKNIFRFSIYGSSTVRSETDIYYDRNLFNPKRYLPFGLDSTVYVNNPNFRPTDIGDSLPKTIPIAHESRLFGVNLTWRGMNFTYHLMNRQDFSGLGLSPLAISWSDPSSRLDERLETFFLGFRRTKNKYTISNNLSLLRYQINQNSTSRYIFDQLSAAVYYSQIPSSGTANEAVLNRIYQDLNSNERYLAARGFDARWETLLQAKLAAKWSLDAGLQINLGGGTPLIGHFTAPVELDFGGYPSAATQPYAINTGGNIESNFFGQVSYAGKKFRMDAGAGLHLYEFSDPQLQPRIAAMYKVDSSWSVYANFSKGIRTPSLYQSANTYGVTPSYQVSLNAQDGAFETEKLYSTEIGVRSTEEGSRSDFIFFAQNAYNLVRNGYLWQSSGSDSLTFYGYRNAPGLAQRMWGFQLILRRGESDLVFGAKRKIQWRNDFFLQYARGEERFGYGISNITDVRNVPRWTTQFRSTVVAKRFVIMLASNRNSAVVSNSVIYNKTFQRTNILDQLPKFRTWDMMARVYLSNHFLLYLHVINLFDSEYSGIDATGSPDDLLYNPQQRRIIRLGVNYNMN